MKGNSLMRRTRAFEHLCVPRDLGSAVNRRCARAYSPLAVVLLPLLGAESPRPAFAKRTLPRRTITKA